MGEVLQKVKEDRLAEQNTGRPSVASEAGGSTRQGILDGLRRVTVEPEPKCTVREKGKLKKTKKPPPTNPLPPKPQPNPTPPTHRAPAQKNQTQRPPPTPPPQSHNPNPEKLRNPPEPRPRERESPRGRSLGFSLKRSPKKAKTPSQEAYRAVAATGRGTEKNRGVGGGQRTVSNQNIKKDTGEKQHGTPKNRALHTNAKKAKQKQTRSSALPSDKQRERPAAHRPRIFWPGRKTKAFLGKHTEQHVSVRSTRRPPLKNSPLRGRAN